MTGYATKSHTYRGRASYTRRRDISMNRPHVHADQLIHLHDETAAPTATIKTHELPGKRFVHIIKITSGAWAVAEFSIFSDFDAPLLVTQIDERPGAEDQ